MHEPLLPTQFILYGTDDYYSHVVVLLLEEKGIEYRFGIADSDELAQLNPYKTLPILVGRDVALYEIGIIFEYLEERHPAHKLLPTTPKDRAIVRTLAWRIQHDWLSLGKILLTHADSFDLATAHTAQKSLSDILTTLTPIFAKKDFFLANSFGWCDVLLGPLLYRLESMGVHLSTQLCWPIFTYRARLMARPAFQSSLKQLNLPKLKES